MRLRDRGDDREPEPGAPRGAGARRIGAVEALEHLLDLLGVMPGPLSATESRADPFALVSVTSIAASWSACARTFESRLSTT